MKIMLDTINLTFVDFFDYELAKKSHKELPTYEYFPKIQKLYEFFKWDKRDFILKRLGQNFYKLYDDIYLEIKNYSANGEKSNPEKKLVMVQIKGFFFLKNKYEQFQNIIAGLKDLEIKISKIEIATDTQNEYVYETMIKTLKYRNEFIKLSGKDTKYYFNFSQKKYESITLSNSVMLIKVYNKLEEINLDRNKAKIDFYYEKTGFEKDQDITRLELSLKRSSSINQNLLDEIVLKNEEEFKKALLKEILIKMEILKNSNLKKLVQKLNEFCKIS